MSEECNEQESESEGDPPEVCPVPTAHERFEEAHWHLHQMLWNYHIPQPFRFSANAFLYALKSVMDMLRLDLENTPHAAWRNQRITELKKEPIFRTFSQGRDIVMHRKPLIQSSRVERGLIKHGKVKLALENDLKTDVPSSVLLRELIEINSQRPIFVAPDHPFLGEQLGVRRTYYEHKLSDEHDVVTASHLALMTVADVLRDAHARFRLDFSLHGCNPEVHHDVSLVDVWAETDEDPEAVQRWGWD
ncbi:hypothetical protein [Nocardia aurea]|uniref:Uncharacterized protein n=1 Tax=Nocardia aurea TaxID=2144174 RepID=A0ABV3G538_9NOCA